MVATSSWRLGLAHPAVDRDECWPLAGEAGQHRRGCYSAGIVFNAVRPDCVGLVTMDAEGTIPFVFVSRDVGLRSTRSPSTPDEKLAYFSYDAGGFRVATYNHDRLEEVGAFIDEGGNNS